MFGSKREAELPTWLRMMRASSSTDWAVVLLSAAWSTSSAKLPAEAEAVNARGITSPSIRRTGRTGAAPRSGCGRRT